MLAILQCVAALVNLNFNTNVYTYYIYHTIERYMGYSRLQWA